jgi:solute:Na+ symporter, SSS family
MQRLQSLDYVVFFTYFVIVAAYGLWVYFRKKKTEVDSKDYFLAEGSLTWWAIGASLIASNISAEQFIGMSGAGFKLGLAVASYEWMAAATLIVVAVFFMPVYLKNKIFTMPQFLSRRYNDTVAMIMAVFWLLLYVVVNLTSILFLGALAISSISGLSLDLCMYGLAIFAILITLGGMKVIGYTDVIQVFFLVLGGLVTTYLALNLVAEQNGSTGIWDGFGFLSSQAGDHLHMILKRDNVNYLDLPGLTVLLGGMWVANFSYWGCNQYITQRALGADLPTARKGILFAAFLKLMMPLIVVVPGIAMFALYQNGGFQTEMLGADGQLTVDRAYPTLLNLLPAGLKGLSFAALTAAIVASLAGKINSIATIFTLDIYKKVLVKSATEQQQVRVGQITVALAMVIAVLIAPHLGIDKGGLNYIQEYTGFVSPGIFAMFLLGFFWKKATSNAALFATIGGFLLSVLLKFLPRMTDLSWLQGMGFSKLTADGIYEIPFLDRMGFVFVLCMAGMWVISSIENPTGEKSQKLESDKSLFKVSNGFLVGSLLVMGALVALYWRFW